MIAYADVLAIGPASAHEAATAVAQPLAHVHLDALGDLLGHALADGVPDGIAGAGVSATAAGLGPGFALETLSDVLVDVDSDGVTEIGRVNFDLLADDLVGVILDDLDPDDDFVWNGSALQVLERRANHFRIILQITDTAVAGRTQESSHCSSFVIMIDSKPGNDTVCALALLRHLRTGPLANCA